MHERLAIAMAKLLASSKKALMREDVSSVLSSYAHPNRKFGMPTLSQTDAERIIRELTAQTYESQQRELSHSAKQHLRDLGYRQP